MKPGDAVGLIDTSDMVSFGNMIHVVEGYQILVHVVRWTTKSFVDTYCNRWVDSKNAHVSSDVPTCLECICSMKSTRRRPDALMP